MRQARPIARLLPVLSIGLVNVLAWQIPIHVQTVSMTGWLLLLTIIAVAAGALAKHQPVWFVALCLCVPRQMMSSERHGTLALMLLGLVRPGLWFLVAWDVLPVYAVYFVLVKLGAIGGEWLRRRTHTRG